MPQPGIASSRCGGAHGYGGAWDGRKMRTPRGVVTLSCSFQALGAARLSGRSSAVPPPQWLLGPGPLDATGGLAPAEMVEPERRHLVPYRRAWRRLPTR